MIHRLPTADNITAVNVNEVFHGQEKTVNMDEFYDKYAPALYGEIKRMLHEDEISQKVLTKAFQKINLSINDFDPARERIFISALKIVRKEITRAKAENGY